jgi:hypothetical protein
VKAPVEIFVEGMVGPGAWEPLSDSMKRLWLEAASAGMAVFADPPAVMVAMVAQAMRDEHLKRHGGGAIRWDELARAALLLLTMPPISHPPFES